MASKIMDDTTLTQATGRKIPLWPQGQTPLFEPSYGQNEPALYPYLLKGKSAGAVIICPGGAYVRKAAHEAEPVALRFNELGYHAFVLDYRVNPYLYPCCLLDVQRAVRMVRFHGANWGVKTDKIAVLGFSAGGHLATTTLTHFDYGDADSADPVQRVSCRPDAVLPCYAVMSMKEYAHAGSREYLLGDHPDPALLTQLSAHLNIREDTPPAFLFHTAQDQSVPVHNTLLFGRALCERGICCAVHVYPFGGHGMGLCYGNDDRPTLAQARHWSGDAGRFLKELGF